MSDISKKNTELEALELKQKAQELEALELRNELLREELEEKKKARVAKIDKLKAGEAQEADKKAKKEQAQDRCNHHTGGKGAQAIVYGQGDTTRPTAVGGLKFPDGSVLLRCARCGEEARNGDPNFNEFLALLSKSSFDSPLGMVGGIAVSKPTQVA